MGIIQAYKMAIKSIVGNKVRSLLTMLGVIIGVGAVIVAVAFAEGSTKSITDTIKGMGTNLVQISIMGRGSNRNVTYDSLAEFAEGNSDIIAAVSPTVNGSVTIKAGNKSKSTSLIGTNQSYEIVRNVHVQPGGRFILPFDLEYRQRVVLIGTAVANDLFEGQDPIGKNVKINGQIFNVVGVLAEKAGGQDNSEDDQVIIPVTVAQRLLRSAIIRNFAVQATTEEAVGTVMEKLNDFLLKIYKNENAFRVFDQSEMLSTLNSITGTMMLVLGGIAAISLIVGGIGIMNIMLVSVSERTREIGIRKAIGAKRRNILVQFLIEALVVTGIGGLLGVLIGVAVIHFVLGGFGLVPEVYSPIWITLSFMISLIIGLVFGAFPAYKAASMNPIAALRSE